MFSDFTFSVLQNAYNLCYHQVVKRETSINLLKQKLESAEQECARLKVNIYDTLYELQIFYDTIGIKIYNLCLSKHSYKRIESL